MAYLPPFRAPFSAEEIKILQERQSQKMGYYICMEHNAGEHHKLTVTKDGLQCPDCKSVQDWAVREISERERKAQSKKSATRWTPKTKPEVADKA